MKKKLIYCLFATMLTSLASVAQDEASHNHQITLSTYVDGYYAGYNTAGNPNTFRPFTTVGARGNSIGVNVAQFGVNYEHSKVRSNLVLHFGDIPQATWSPNFNHIQEGNVGINLADGWWLDAGAFATHIGTESFLPKNNMLSSTAFKTYNEPFYQTGAKLTYDGVEDLEVQLWALNGYNSFVDNNKSKTVGLLVSYDLSDDASITYTNLLGREDGFGSAIKQMRFYQNVYLNAGFQNWVFLTVGFDVGIQTNSDLSDAEKTAVMYAGVLTTRVYFNEEWSMTGRAEIFNDKSGFISGVLLDTDGEAAGLELVALTLGTEYRPMESTYFRVETRSTRAPEYLEVFGTGEDARNTRMELLVTLGLELEKVFGF